MSLGKRRKDRGMRRERRVRLILWKDFFARLVMEFSSTFPSCAVISFKLFSVIFGCVWLSLSREIRLGRSGKHEYCSWMLL